MRQATMVVEPLLPLDERYLRSRAVSRAMMNMAVCVIGGVTEDTGLRGAGGGLDIDAIRRVVETRIHRMRRYRQRLMPSPLGLTTAAWVDDDDFDVAHHVWLDPRVLETDADIDALIADLQTRPLDLSRPAWDVVAAGFANGDLLIVIRLHHVLGDGVFGQAMIAALFLEEPTPLAIDAPAFVPRTPRNGGQLLWEMGRQWWSSQEGLEAAVHDYRRKPFPQRLRRTAGRSIRGPRDAWLHRRNPAAFEVPDREVRLVHTDLVATKRRARELGGSVNDLLVSAAACGLAAMARQRGEVVDGRVEHVLVPISGRPSGDTSPGNMVRTTAVEVPLDAPVEDVLPVVHDRIRKALRLSGRQASTNSPTWAVSASMLPGPRRRWFFAGAHVATMTFAPGVDPAERLTLFAITYEGKLSVSINARADLRPSLPAFVEAFTSTLHPVSAVPEPSAGPRRDGMGAR